tara:strand:- start:912 stop:1328 length:417 start_codon:yes stop_codon:yes gene_type:complete
VGKIGLLRLLIYCKYELEKYVGKNSNNYNCYISEIDCIKLKGAIGIRMHDNSKYQKTEKLANTANGWTIQEKCVEKTNFIKFNEGSKLEYQIPIPDCLENFNTIYTNNTKNKAIIDIIQLITITVIAIFSFRKIFSQH